MRRLLVIVPVTALAALVTAGCSSGSAQHSGRAGAAAPSAATDGAGGVQQITIHANNEFRFSPASISAHVGTVRVTLVDDGSYPHNLAVSSLHETSETVSGNPGASMTSITLNFPHAGTYKFVCTYHSSAGMVGQFVIR